MNGRAGGDRRSDVDGGVELGLVLTQDRARVLLAASHLRHQPNTRTAVKYSNRTTMKPILRRCAKRQLTGSATGSGTVQASALG
jgi:hypothetical protein